MNMNLYTLTLCCMFILMYQMYANVPNVRYRTRIIEGENPQIFSPE